MAPPNTRTVEDIFKEYEARRRGILDALTYDASEFYEVCDPVLNDEDEKDKEDNEEKADTSNKLAEAISLFGYPDETWKAITLEEEIPPSIPVPTLGINLVRDTMSPKDWLSFVARHCGAWLLSVTFFAGDHLKRDERNQLFNMINSLPTLTEEVARRNYAPDGKKISMKPKGDSDDNNLCGFCGNNGDSDNAWVGCDTCQKWYHCKCENISPEAADSMDTYVCRACPKLTKRRRSRTA